MIGIDAFRNECTWLFLNDKAINDDTLVIGIFFKDEDESFCEIHPKRKRCVYIPFRWDQITIVCQGIIANLYVNENVRNKVYVEMTGLIIFAAYRPLQPHPLYNGSTVT